MFYVNTHVAHHKYTDTDRDPVAPIRGFWYSNLGWFCNNDYVASKVIILYQLHIYTALMLINVFI